jgi:hypothetical protein
VELNGWSRFAFAVLTERSGESTRSFVFDPWISGAGNRRRAVVAPMVVGVESAATLGADAVSRRLTEPHW